MGESQEQTREFTAAGVWFVPAAVIVQVSAAQPSGADAPRVPPAFYYDGTTVTTALTMAEDWIWKSADGIYKLQVRWDGEEVLIRTPFEGWKYFVTMKLDVFHRYENSLDWVYKRATGAKLLGRYARLTSPRELHDYAINLLGEREEGWQDGIDG
jgi:hypothetical protein